jgi:hypothetical protein
MAGQQNPTQTGQQNPAFLRATWRRTRMGGITHPIALNLVSGRLQILEPIREEYSRSHSHGVWYYPPQVDILIYLEQSNTGRRSVYVICRLEPQLCRTVETVARMWLSGATTREVEEALDGLELAAYG